MRIALHHRNVLEVEADTLALPVDGSAPGLEGRIARQFMARLGVQDMHELYAPPPYYPFNGDCHWSNLAPFADKTHFRYLCALGMLSHDPEAKHEGYIASAFGRMIGLAFMDPGMGEHIACPVLTGGNRMDYVSAVYLMLKEIEETRNTGVTVHIAEADAERFEVLQSIIAG